jgi:hypothetical protein
MVTLAPEAPQELPGGSTVVLDGGARFRITDGHLTADSLVAARRDGARIAVSRRHVVSVEERRVSTSRTLALVGGVLFGTVVAFTALAVSAGPGLP